MVRDRLNKIFASKLFYIVFSLLASIALWLFVDLSLNETVEVSIKDVQVVFLNEELLHDKNFVKTTVSPQTLSLRIECKQSLRSKLNASTVYVTVDLANITKVGPHYLTYVVENTLGIAPNQLDVSGEVDRIIVSVDRLFTKTIQVTGEYKGGHPSEDLYAEPVEINPGTITVYGPEAAVARVDHAFVDIKRENLQSTTVIEDAPIILLDTSGEVIDDEAVLNVLDLSQETVTVTIPVRQTKDIPLKVDLIHGAGTNEQNVKVTTNPLTISITGEPDAMSDFNSLTVGIIDLTKFESTTTETFPIVVPNVFGYQGEAEVTVTVEIIGLETRHFLATNLQCTGVTKGLTATILTPGLDVRIRGRTGDLDSISAENISIVADLTDYKEGGASVPVKITIIGNSSDIGPVGGEYRIPVAITKE